MIKCEIKNAKAMVEANGTLDDITCDILVLVSSLYEKMNKADTPLIASLFKDGLKKAFRDDVPFNVEDEPRNVMTDVKESADDLISWLEELTDFVKERNKKNDKGTKD